MTFRLRLLSLLMITLSWLPSGALAHSKAGHSTAQVVKEQKPWGIAGDAGKASRTITIRMTDDMRFSPRHLRITQGETVRLVVVNAGKVLHELVLGTAEELQAHAELMRKHPGMEHDEPYMTHVEAGRRGEIVWTFNRPGNFEFACLIPGHFEAGMKGSIEVRPAASRQP